MHRTTALVLFFYFSASQADNIIETDCLTIKRDGDRVSFSYAKKNEQDRPYFYAKVMMSGGGERLTLREVLRFGVDLVYLSQIEPKAYQVPKGGKNIFIVKAEKRIDGFNQSSRIVPVIVDKLDDKKKRNAGNYSRLLPKEKKITFKNTLGYFCLIN